MRTSKAITIACVWTVAAVSAAGATLVVLSDATARVTDPVAIATDSDAWWPPLTAPRAPSEHGERSTAAPASHTVAPGDEAAAPSAGAPTPAESTSGGDDPASTAVVMTQPATDRAPTSTGAGAAPTPAPVDGTPPATGDGAAPDTADAGPATGEPAAIEQPTATPGPVEIATDGEPEVTAVEEPASVTDAPEDKVAATRRSDEVWAQDWWHARWQPWTRRSGAEPAVPSVPAPRAVGATRTQAERVVPVTAPTTAPLATTSPSDDATTRSTGPSRSSEDGDRAAGRGRGQDHAGDDDAPRRHGRWRQGATQRPGQRG